MRLSLSSPLPCFFFRRLLFGQNDDNIEVNVQKCLIAYSINSIHASVWSVSSPLNRFCRGLYQYKVPCRSVGERSSRC